MVSLLTYKWTNYQNNNTYLCFVAVVTKSKPGEKTFRPNINQEISVDVPVGALTGTDWTSAQWKPDLTDSMTDEITPFSPLAVAISKWLFWVSTNLDAAFQRLKDTDCSFCNERRDIYRQYVFCTRLIRAGHASTWKNVNFVIVKLSQTPKNKHNIWILDLDIIQVKLPDQLMVLPDSRIPSIAAQRKFSTYS